MDHDSESPVSADLVHLESYTPVQDRAKSYVPVRTGTYQYIPVHASTGFLEMYIPVRTGIYN
jgi:hypothetical protein